MKEKHDAMGALIAEIEEKSRKKHAEVDAREANPNHNHNPKPKANPNSRPIRGRMA